MRIEFDRLTDENNLPYTVATIVEEKNVQSLSKVVEHISKFYGYPTSNHLNISSRSWRFPTVISKREKDMFKDVYISSKRLLTT